jgi:hypothetical protein
MHFFFFLALNVEIIHSLAVPIRHHYFLLFAAHFRPFSLLATNESSRKTKRQLYPRMRLITRRHTTPSWVSQTHGKYDQKERRPRLPQIEPGAGIEGARAAKLPARKNYYYQVLYDCVIVSL